MMLENKHKYTFEYAKMPKSTYDTIQKYFENIYPKFKELVDETYNHQILVLNKMEKVIDERTRIIMKESDV